MDTSNNDEIADLFGDRLISREERVGPDASTSIRAGISSTDATSADGGAIATALFPIR
jgi:hypothetical protein